MMGTCVVLFVLAWAVVRIWSVPAAIGMCLVAMVIPPVAAIVANRRGPEDRWWDEQRDPPDDTETKPPHGRATRSRERHSARSAKSGRPHRLGKASAFNSCGDPESDAWWAELDGGSRQDRRE